MNQIKLIDGLMLLDRNKDVPEKYAAIMIMFAIIGLAFFIATLEAENVLFKIILLMVSIASIIGILLIDRFEETDYYKVAIVDNNKCTIQDIMDNYKIIDQEGAIYKIQLEDNE